MNDDQSSAQIVSHRDTNGRFTKGWKGGGRKLGSRQKIAEDFLADFHAVWRLDALRETALAEPAKFCAIAAHLIRNEQIDVRSGDGFRDCRSAEEVFAKIREELGPEAAAALRRFNRSLEKQAEESRFYSVEGHVIDVGPDEVNRQRKSSIFPDCSLRWVPIQAPLFPIFSNCYWDGYAQGNKLLVPFFQGLLAEIEAHDDAEGALTRIDEALALAGETGETPFCASRKEGLIILRECQPLSNCPHLLSKRLNLLRIPRTGYEPAHEKDQNGTWNDDMRHLGNRGPFLGPKVEGVHDERGGLGME